MMWIECGAYGWINLGQVRSIERRGDAGAVTVHLLGGQEIGLLPDEGQALETALRAAVARQGNGPGMLELRDGRG